MMKKVTKAVIPAAGLGTRVLPATKAMPKGMLPIVDKPAIQYQVEEAVRSGITDILLIILLAMAIKEPLESLATTPGFGWMQQLGPHKESNYHIFALLYWVGMARIVRAQVLTLKESEYVTAARALGASGGRIIKKHLLTNCMGTLIVTTTLQIPSSIFTESYLSFIGLGVAAPLPSLGSLATDAVKGMNTYPHLLIAPAVMTSVMILVFNLFGDGLRDAFDPKLKN